MANERSQRDTNRETVMLAVTNDSNLYITELRVDPITKRLLISATTSDSVGSAVLYGRATWASGGTVALASVSTPLKNGMIVQALSTNSGSIYIGDSAVTSANGFELQAGQATSVAITDAQSVSMTGVGSLCWISSN